MKFWILALTVGISSIVTVGISSIVVSAQDCYKITGWSSTSYVGAQAYLLPVSCGCTPSGTAWLFIWLAYGAGPNPDLYLRINTSDSRINSGVFSPLLVFSHYDATTGEPVVKTDLILARQPTNSMQSTVNPPVQGSFSSNDRVRLRHRNTGNCLVSQNINGAVVRNYPCADDPAQIYVLVDAGAGKRRLQHEASNPPLGQCLYTLASNGATVHNWGCWMDPNMEFNLVPSLGGYRLQHVQNNQCIYGNPQNGGLVHSWVCWNDPNMVYMIDSMQCVVSVTLN